MLGGPNANISQQAQQLMNNPDLMREMMNTPFMQNMMNNPQLLQSLFADNPAIQQVVQRNPELGHVLNDPDVIRQTMEMIRNPTMFNEMMRNHDQAIRNLQGIPGGEAALQRLYQDVQEPLLNSAVGSLSSNPYTSTNEQDTACEFYEFSKCYLNYSFQRLVVNVPV
jgi:ubiquilin